MTDEQSDDARVVYTFPKNSREEIRAALKTWNGLRLADLRVWFDTDTNNENGDPIYRPSKKGLCLSTRHLADLLEAVQKLIEGEAAA